MCRLLLLGAGEARARPPRKGGRAARRRRARAQRGGLRPHSAKAYTALISAVQLPEPLTLFRENAIISVQTEVNPLKGEV